MLVHRSTPCPLCNDMFAGSTSETEIIEIHRFSFLVLCGDGLPRFDGRAACALSYFFARRSGGKERTLTD
jgi:hypothetical protein